MLNQKVTDKACIKEIDNLLGDQAVSFEKGDSVKVIAAAADLPMPQFLYSEKVGTVVEVPRQWTGLYRVAYPEDVALSGADASTGVGFYADEIQKYDPS